MPAPLTAPSTTLAQDMTTAANQGKPGFDVLGNKIGDAQVIDNQARAKAMGIDIPGVGGGNAITPTTISGDKSQTINDNTQAVNAIGGTVRGNVTGADTFERYSNGDWANAPSDATAVTDENGRTVWQSGGKSYYLSPDTAQYQSPVDRQSMELIDGIKSQTDAAFAGQISSIKAQFKALIKQQQDSNVRQSASVDQTLLMGGTSRYAGVNAAGISSAQVNYGLQKISDLQNQENSAVSSLISAQASKDYETVGKKLELIKQINDKKQKEVNDMNEKLTTANEKIRQETQTKNNAIDDDIRTAILDAQKGGALPEQLKKMQTALASHDYAGAVTAGGDSLSNASGIIGEYNYYKKDAVAHGQVPLSFNDYQTADANRKAKIAAAGIDTSSQSSQQSIAGDAQDVLEGRNSLLNIRQTMGRSNAAASYMEALRNYIRKVDSKFDFVASDAGGKSVGTSYVQRSMGAINTVLPNIDMIVNLSNQVGRVGVKGFDAALQKAGMQFGNEKISNFHQAQKLIADEIGVALGAGSVSDMKLQLGFDVTDPSVTPEVFASNMEIVRTMLENRKTGLNELRYKSDQVGDNTNTVSTGTGNQIKADETAAETKVLEYGKTNAGDQEKIRQMVNDGVPYVQIMQAFNIQ